jgi:hypothetical protein
LANKETPMHPYPAAFTYQLQRDTTLLDAIADWSASSGAERGRNRRYAMRLLAAERARRDWRRAELLAAARCSPTMLQAAA